MASGKENKEKPWKGRTSYKHIEAWNDTFSRNRILKEALYWLGCFYIQEVFLIYAAVLSCIREYTTRCTYSKDLFYKPSLPECSSPHPLVVLPFPAMWLKASVCYTHQATQPFQQDTQLGNLFPKSPYNFRESVWHLLSYPWLFFFFSFYFFHSSFIFILKSRPSSRTLGTAIPDTRMSTHHF